MVGMDTDSDASTETRIKPQRRQELEHLLKTNPTDRNAYLELAAIYRCESRPLEAKRVLDQAHDLFPDDLTILWELEEATLARSLQQYRGFSDLAKRLETAEAEREVQRSASDWALRRIEVCHARLQRDPALRHLHLARAEAFMDVDRFEEAIEEIQPVLNSDEHSPQAHLILGRALLATGKDAPAMAALRAASLRRAVVAPVRVRVAALRLLCETAERLGVELTLARYRESLHQAEHELANLSPPNVVSDSQIQPGRSATDDTPTLPSSS
tara:strand:+ start:297789 stop:298601 length:813 start_codon:yes stop_codon:yes gene_type:complete